VGWAVGLFFEISEAAIAVLFGFLAGGVIMNVLKEELPEERESRFWAFALGAALYTVVLLLAF
jgi:zinc transporter ZupT